MIFAKIINVIKSTYYNLKLFPFPVAIKFPLIVGNKCKIEAYRGSIIIDGDIRRKMFSFGISGSMGIQENAKCGLYISGGGANFSYMAQWISGLVV